MMRTAERYIFEELGVEMPKGEINGSWFSENGLPMIVECSCCGMTMALPSAMIDDDGHCFCSSCSCEFDEPIDIDDDCGFDPYEGCYTYDCQKLSTMRNLIKVIVWFFVINFSICNHIWTDPVFYWWIIEIIILIISILMVDKPTKKQYNKYKIKERKPKGKGKKV